jgi:hypothetical protein
MQQLWYSLVVSFSSGKSRVSFGLNERELNVNQGERQPERFGERC